MGKNSGMVTSNVYLRFHSTMVHTDDFGKDLQRALQSVGVNPNKMGPESVAPLHSHHHIGKYLQENGYSRRSPDLIRSS